MTRPSFLLWSGPVYADTPDKVVWQSDVEKLVLSGAGSSYFGQLAESLRDGQGRILPNILAKMGKTRADYDKVAVAGFSAAHGLLAPLLLSDGDDIDAAILIDSCFSAMETPAKPGYVSFARRAGAGSRLMVMSIGPGGGPGSGATVAPGNADFSSAIDCATESTRSAGTFSPFPLPEGMPPMAAQPLRSGGCILLDYREYRHDQHIGQLAVPMMQVFLAPYLAGGGIVGGSSSKAAAMLLGAAAAFGLTRVMRHRRRR